MKFIITRTSMHSDELPCREAKMELLYGFSDCTCKTVAQALKIEGREYDDYKNTP